MYFCKDCHALNGQLRVRLCKLMKGSTCMRAGHGSATAAIHERWSAPAAAHGHGPAAPGACHSLSLYHAWLPALCQMSESTMEFLPHCTSGCIYMAGFSARLHEGLRAVPPLCPCLYLRSGYLSCPGVCRKLPC